MKKTAAVLFLFLFVFQTGIFADTASPSSESKFKKAERQTAGWVQKTGQSLLDFTYVVMRKLDIAG